ncbi:MAG TPA: glucose 1-dehydrogenase [Dehalococcoidia bacterium]|nr:glucose 1-dehydrogenase [Dehalococcoidia bacterium]
MKKEFTGKVALVTGGASGIGRGVALMFAGRGAKVVVATDSNIQGGEETVEMIKKSGGEGMFVKCDVTRAGDVETMVNKTVEIYGALDFAFNNAGVGPDGKRLPVVNIVDCPEEIWDKTLDVNLKGVFLCMKFEIKQMIKQGHGAIVNTSSVGALKPMAGFAAYDASKTGLHGLSKAAALECAPYGIRVNVICPAPTERTRLFENLTDANPGMKDGMKNGIPLKRVATPEDMGEAVLWLCSDAASFITGHIMPVDGGMT